MNDNTNSNEPALDKIARHHRAIAESPLVRAPIQTIAIGVAIGVLAGTILISGMLFLLGLPSPW